ncbi:ATP-binding protein [Spirosoma litoris]
MKSIHPVHAGLLLWLLLVCYNLYGQTHSTELPYLVSAQHLTFGKATTALGQDQQGFIWLGTLENAYRFDGRQFDALPEPDKSASNQAFNPLTNYIYPDWAGNLWLTGGMGEEQRKIWIVRPGETRALTFSQAFNRPDPFQNDPILRFAQTDNQPFRYLLTAGGRLVRHLGEGRFRTIGRWHSSKVPTALLGTLETTEGTLLLSVQTGKTPFSSTLLEIDSLGHIVNRQEFPHPLAPIARNAQGTLYLQKVTRYTNFKDLPHLATHQLEGFLFQLSPTGVLAPLSVQFARNPLADQSENALMHLVARYDAQRNLFWISGIRTCFAWHPRLGVIFDLLATNVPTASMQQYRRSLIDRTGAVWFATDDGVVLLTLEPNQFKRYLYQPDQKPTVTRNSIRGMVQLGNRLWVNTTESYWLDLATGKGVPVLSDTDPAYKALHYLYPAIADQRGTIWSILYNLINITPSTNQVVSYRLQPDLSYNQGMALWHDGRQHIWIGYDRGLSIFDVVKKQNRPFTDYNGFTELAQNRVNGFFPDARVGGIWVAATSGLYLLDTLRGITARYSTRDKAPSNDGSASETAPALPFDHITYIHPDSDNQSVYWLATRGGGLIRWNRATGQYQQFTEKQGLSNNTIYCIYEDRHQRLWLPSDYGLMAFHRKTHQIQIFHTINGIADKEFNLTAHYRAPDGCLFLGGLNGITAFYPDQIGVNKPNLVPLLLTQYRKLEPDTGEMVDWLTDYQRQQRVHLTTDDKWMSLSFALLDYRYLGKTRLWYRITGWQDRWVMQNELELRLNHLPPGDYGLELRAQTTNGDWISPVLTIPIHVDRPIYLHTWFLLLCALLLVGVIGTVFRWRNRQLVRDKLLLEAEVARRTAQIEEDKATIERDKTIIEQQAADLQANVTLKSRFFANVSHELRTPLTLMLGPLQYLTHRVVDESAQSLLGVMERNTKQLLTLVNDLLDLTRLDNQQAQLREQPADLTQLIHKKADNFSTQARYLGIYLYVVGADDPVWMMLDTQKMETVLRNLLANALRYTSTGGSIQVQLAQTETLVEIKVTDTGAGIHPDDIPHIFERYFQSKQTDKPLHGGTGIGLALCQEYCQLWGGSIQVNSELGKGSTFTITYPIRPITLPVSLNKPVAKQAIPPVTSLPALFRSDETDEVSHSSRGKSILIVEDHVDMLLYIQMLLSPHYELLIARNGRQALDLLHQLSTDHLPDLIVSDIMMPEIDGMALVNALREHATFAHVPIILLTARVDLETRLQALRLGIADYLTKPFNEMELLVRIQQLLQRADEQARFRQQLSEETGFVKEPALSQDAEWIDALQQLIRQHLTNPNLTIHFLAEANSMSERQLYRRMGVLTGLSPNQFIQEVRLQVAHELLEKQPETLIKSVGYQVGYQNTSYFIRIYRERFGVSPGERSRAAANVTVK